MTRSPFKADISAVFEFQPEIAAVERRAVDITHKGSFVNRCVAFLVAAKEDPVAF